MGRRDKKLTGWTMALGIACAGVILTVWRVSRHEPEQSWAATQPMPPVEPANTPVTSVVESPFPRPGPTPSSSALERAKGWGVFVEVKKGETLIDLAADHLGSPDRWRELLEVNSDKMSRPERLLAGMAIRLPEGVRPATAEEIRVSRFRRSIRDLRFEWYTAAAGDSLASIARVRYGDAAKAAWIVNANADAFPTPPDAGAALAEGLRLRLPKEYVPGDGCGG
jgi:nucleoid-associated protein YgaU